MKLIPMKLLAKSTTSSRTTFVESVWTLKYPLLRGNVFRGKFWIQKTWKQTF